MLMPLTYKILWEPVCVKFLNYDIHKLHNIILFLDPIVVTIAFKIVPIR